MPAKLALAVLLSISAFGQSSQEACVLETAKTGDRVKIRAEARKGGHGRFILPESCAGPANIVILIWADDPSLGSAKSSVRKDRPFMDFNSFLTATFPLPPHSVGTGQAKYRVVADFEGLLEVTPSAGIKRDPVDRKVIGIEGFGHPVPFTQFRLLATGVSRVESSEQPLPYTLPAPLTATPTSGKR